MQKFLDLLSKTGYFNLWVDMTDQERFDLLNWRFWIEVERLGYKSGPLRAYCWRMAGKPESEFIKKLR